MFRLIYPLNVSCLQSEGDEDSVESRHLSSASVLLSVTPSTPGKDVIVSFFVDISSDDSDEAKDLVGFSNMKYRVVANLGPPA